MCWHSDYARVPNDWSAWEVGGDYALRVVRGGGWFNETGYLRSANRYRFPLVKRSTFSVFGSSGHYDTLCFACLHLLFRSVGPRTDVLHIEKHERLRKTSQSGAGLPRAAHLVHSNIVTHISKKRSHTEKKSCRGGFSRPGLLETVYEAVLSYLFFSVPPCEANFSSRVMGNDMPSIWSLLNRGWRRPGTQTKRLVL